MTDEQKRLVHSTWGQIAPISATAATLFYDRLFATHPELRPLFATDLTEQKAKLMKMIGVAVGGLSDLAAVVPAVQAMGVRHAGYGVRPADYDPVGAALLWTLEQGLGERFTPDVRTAWTATYAVLATVMKDAAASTAAA